MKYIFAAIALTSIVVSSSVSANGFAPWRDNGNTSMKLTAEEAPGNVEIRSFYRANEPRLEVTPGEQQADIQIVPWYTADRV